MIRLTNLNYHYRKAESLFQNLNLELESGNIYGLLGKNGAGKSTLLRLMTGLLHPKSGTVEAFGYRPAERRPEMLSDIYFLPEEVYVPAITVPAFVKAYAPFYPKFDHAAFENYFSRFDVPKGKKMTQMSFGQKHKTLLCFALATNSRLLILDEPTNGLDIPSKSIFRSVLVDAVSEDRTVIISTHQVRDMANLIDPIILLDNGNILFQESLESITNRLHFELISSMTAPEGAIYAERVPGGFYAVSENTSGELTEPDIEVLFNAIIANPLKMKELFS